ncbi:Peroxiredoxin [Micrococcales bacterium KH10]|nr:Peroxiredoxin [Micrococcales bacterium KH10]
MAQVPDVGALAPEFSLTNTHSTPVRLEQFRGGGVLIVFFPFAFSRICHGELCELRDNLHRFTGNDVTVLGISTDSMFALKAWAEQEEYDFDLLSDFWPHGEVAQRYGVFDETNGMALRGSFLIDSDGKIAWRVVNERSQPRALDGYFEALTQI